ncbi:MAG: EAL domain-containing protein, partial [Gammaproteobacteria bacterium]|nr:EAL domain-containing protein [Gammaproteobacteria bacterium]
DVTATLLSEMGKYGLPESTVNVELTETALARNETEMVPILERMAANEIRIYLDDFGTGYSSLNRLHLLPFHYLKVDRSFVRRIDKGDQTITRTIIQLAKSLEKKVVVEGVETETQREILERLGADYMQGYLFSRPLPEKELIEWLAGVS